MRSRFSTVFFTGWWKTITVLLVLDDRIGTLYRFATPIASISIRCISSAPTKVFKTIASCIGRSFP
jgi:hypothetical protein